MAGPDAAARILPVEDAPTSEDAAFREAVTQRTDAIVVSVGAQFDAERYARGWTAERAAREAGLSRRALFKQRKTLCTPRLDSLVAQALAFGGELEVTFHPRRGARKT